jgi:glucokinase
VFFYNLSQIPSAWPGQENCVTREAQANHAGKEKAVLLLGFDIGGTKTALLLGDSRGRIYRRVEIPTPAAESFDSAFSKIAAAADTFLVQCRMEGLGTPVAVSVSVGGPLDIARGILYAPPHLAAWGEAALKSQLQEHLGLPVYVEHDGNAGALAEFTFGAGRGARNMIFLTMGTGLGAGLILNGKIYHGSSDMAGEVGHIRMAENGPVQYGKAGSWEGFSSGAGLVSLAHLRNPGEWPDTLTTRDIIRSALNGDPAAVQVVAEAGRWFGRGLAVLVDILNPDLIVVGTLGVVLGDLLLLPARAALREEALPRAVDTCRIVPAQLGSQLGDIAALMAAIVALQQEEQ